jgi:glycosyltransferase involved in cell wall biosynthesis
MEINPKISVLMPVMNEEKFLTESIRSVLDQSFADFELIVVDNGSSDTSWELIMDLRKRDERIRVLRNRNPGFTASLNLMLELARGSYVARLDADDLALPDRLLSQSKILDSHPEVVMTGGKCKIVDESGKEIYECGPEAEKKMLRWSLLFRNDFWHSATMWRKVSGFRYDSRFTYAQDYELWSRMARQHEVLGSKEIVGTVRKRKKSITENKRKEQDFFASMVSKRNIEHYMGRQINPELSEELRAIFAGSEAEGEAKIAYEELAEKFSEREGLEEKEKEALLRRKNSAKKATIVVRRRINKAMEEKIKISKKRWRESVKKAENGKNYIWLEREERYGEVEICDYEISPAYGASTEKSPWEGTCGRKPWEYEVTAVIPCLNTPETLPICIELLRLQTKRPFIMLIDTGSTERNLRLTEENRSEDVEVHSIRLNGVRHPSDYPAMAMDAAFSLCRTEYLFATHSDCFLRKRTVLEDFINLCKEKSPVVGYELSPRAHEDWRGMVSHTASMYHMPAMDKIGFGWSLRRLCNRYGIVDYKPDPNKPNWPDTEILGNYILRENNIEPHLVGPEGNHCRNLDDNIDHFRSYGAAKMYSPDYYPKVLGWYHEAKKEALARIEEWSSKVSSSPKP